jgi:hypothetical protein
MIGPEEVGLTENDGPECMAGDYKIPVCSSDVTDVKHDGLSHAESSSGHPPVSHPYERSHAAYTLDQV